MNRQKDETSYDLPALVSALETDPISALSTLCAAAKKRVYREALLSNEKALSRTVALLASAEPKARKNAARFIGALGRETDADALVSALQAEQTLYVIPSILLALGSVGGERALPALNAYALPAAKSEAEQANVFEIAAALEKAQKSLSPAQRSENALFAAPINVILVAPDGFSDMLLREIAARKLQASPHPMGASVLTDQPQKLYSLRCFTELLVPLGENILLAPERIAEAAAVLLPRPYRVELQNYAGDRAAFIRAICGALGGGDNPGNYVSELRVVCKKETCSLYIRPCDLPDGRFSYRKQTLPASIKPALAACLCRYALSFVSAERVRALDPFCGSGTLLIELDKTGRAAALLGVDVAQNAVLAARKNSSAAHVKAQYVQKDCTRFAAREPFDLILSNLPFGNRVGTHESNETLYRAFVSRLPELLKNDGVALLYTMEFRLLASLIEKNRALVLKHTRVAEAGGLHPHVLIVTKR